MHWTPGWGTHTRLCAGSATQLELFGVFDGHGGKQAASYAAKHLHANLAAQLAAPLTEAADGSECSCDTAFGTAEDAEEAALEEVSPVVPHSSASGPGAFGASTSAAQPATEQLRSKHSVPSLSCATSNPAACSTQASVSAPSCAQDGIRRRLQNLLGSSCNGEAVQTAWEAQDAAARALPGAMQVAFLKTQEDFFAAQKACPGLRRASWVLQSMLLRCRQLCAAAVHKQAWPAAGVCLPPAGQACGVRISCGRSSQGCAPQVSGTTATLAAFNGWQLVVANVGDSSAYLDTGSEVLQVCSTPAPAQRLPQPAQARERPHCVSAVAQRLPWARR